MHISLTILQSHQNDDFRGRPYENRQKSHQNDDHRGRFYENRTKMTILEADFMIDLTRSDSNQNFVFYGVGIFTGFEAGFE